MKWASLICEYILFEEEIYPKFFKDQYPNLTELELVSFIIVTQLLETWSEESKRLKSLEYRNHSW